MVISCFCNALEQVSFKSTFLCLLITLQACAWIPLRLLIWKVILIRRVENVPWKLRVDITLVLRSYRSTAAHSHHGGITSAIIIVEWTVFSKLYTYMYNPFTKQYTKRISIKYLFSHIKMNNLQSTWSLRRCIDYLHVQNKRSFPSTLEICKQLRCTRVPNYKKPIATTSVKRSLQTYKHCIRPL